MKTAICKVLMAAIAIESAVMATALCEIAADAPEHTNNVILFVADGLRAGSVNEHYAPEMYHLQMDGVRFTNSHSLFPTVTTANASAIATGHGLGDTGDFGNALYVGYPVPVADRPNTVTPFVENNAVLSNLYSHFEGGYLGQDSLLACARRSNYLTAVIGKLGPALIQHITLNEPGPETIIIDDATGKTNGVPLNAGIATLLTNVGLGTNAPSRGTNGESGDYEAAGTLEANDKQQSFFTDALTKVVLPAFKTNNPDNRPFVIVYWSRDPDGTQHNQGDSLDSFSPGINGRTSKAAIKNCDSNLRKIREALTNWGLDKTTDIFVTADHGFDTISKQVVDVKGSTRKTTKSYGAGFTYVDKDGHREVHNGYLPPGFLAIDLAKSLKTNLFDPDSVVPSGSNYMQVDPTNSKPTTHVLQRPSKGNGLIGGTGRIPTNNDDGVDTQVVITANGGADLIYIPGECMPNKPHTNRALVTNIVGYLTRQDYTGGVFVNDKYGEIPGALNFSQIGLTGSAQIPTPAIIVIFCSFTIDPADPLQHGVMVADTDLQQGQGNHGGFDRAATLNFMAAVGPDFKVGYTDPAPVSNADIAWTLAEILKLDLKPGGLTGRSIQEALAGKTNADVNLIRRDTDKSSEAANGLRTVLDWQEYGGCRYFDAAGFPGRTLGLRQ
jgi:arylsulfatase A-like enzyme